MITRTTAIQRFLQHYTHKDLADLYNIHMEVQVNVAQDGGQRIDGEFKGKMWQAWTDNIERWYPLRIPKNAKSNDCILEDKNMDYDLEKHAEAIGMTGWDYHNKISRWVFFDFDFIIGHSDKHQRKLTEIELQEIINLTTNIPWVTLRRSTGGKGLHIYVFLNPQDPNNNPKNHNEHAAIARSILGKLSALVGFDFKSKVDIVGGNGWIWHRKMKDTNREGLKLIKQGILLDEIPSNWKDHLTVITGVRKKTLPGFLANSIDESISTEAVDLFEEITTQKNFVKLDENHKKLITWLEENNCRWWWDNDRHLLITHTIHLKDAHTALVLKGLFETEAKGVDFGNDHNVFLSNLRGGSWIVRRFGKGVAEASSWFQDGAGYTSCYYNREPDLATVARAHNGIESEKKGFVFREAEVAERVVNLLGSSLDIPVSLNSRETKLKIHKDGRLLVEIERKETDTDSKLVSWLPDKKVWKKIFMIKTPPPVELETSNHDNLVRHVITESGEDYGWLIKNEATGKWNDEPLVHIKAALKSTGLIPKELENVIGQCVTKCWVLVNQPFQPEYPGDRLWNRNSVQLRYPINREKENLLYPSWLSILNHLGKNLTPAILEDNWCKSNGILTGADYLKTWIASLFQEPDQPLPYLFFYGEGNTGKSIIHEALALLVTHGVTRADNALVSNFNGELLSSILAVVEETDLRRNKAAYNKIKDWVTSRMLPVHEKNRTPYVIPNTTHWIQCVSGDTWTLTDQGPRQIIDLLDINCNLIVNGQAYPTKGFFRTGYKQLIKIETTQGYELECTEDHLIQVEMQGFKLWIEAGKLQSGQNICLNEHKNVSWEGEGDFEQGYIIGHIFGDGTFSNLKYKYPVLLFCKDTEPIEYLSNLLPDCNLCKGADATIQLKGKQLTDMCRDLNFCRKEDIYNTEKYSKDFCRGFISGLIDTDGTVNLQSMCVSIGQSNYTLLQMIQRILLRLGVRTSIFKRKEIKTKNILGKKINKIKTQYRLDITNYDNLIVLESLCNLQVTRKTLDLRKLIQPRKFKSREIYYYSPFKQSTKTRITEVYDVIVPEIHAFDANGIIVHNCANESSACPVFPGDKRIVIIPVDIIPVDKIIPKKQFIIELEKEASDFLTAIMLLELPASNDRLNLPVVTTNEKLQIEQSNKNPIELFLESFCYFRPGKVVKYADFYDKFFETLDPNICHHWPKHRIGKELPNKFPKGRILADGAAHYIGNMSFDPPEGWDINKLNPGDFIPTEEQLKLRIICTNDRLKFELTGESPPKVS